MYYFMGVTVARSNRTGKETLSSSVLWHLRLGHPSYGVLSSLPVLDNNVVNHTDSCDICFTAKQTRVVFQESSNKATAQFELIHCDVWGPYRTPSSCGAVYFLTIVDDYSRAVWVHLMLEKSETATLLKNFCAMSVRQFGRHVKTFRTDNGTEFMVLKSYFRQEGSIIKPHLLTHHSKMAVWRENIAIYST